MAGVTISLGIVAPSMPTSALAQDVAVSSPDRLIDLREGLEEMVSEGLLPNAHAVIMLDGQVLANLKFGSLDVESGRELPNDAIYRLYLLSLALRP
ncbi:hypothetical protein [Aurantiacibacter flavus]|uniref:Beta-lactamase-related domain-containing protein n=1 Tax=Aurantiacibacter flavus TaxID=3145232 RepID=A0ABV0D151_9SPHN